MWRRRALDVLTVLLIAVWVGALVVLADSYRRRDPGLSTSARPAPAGTRRISANGFLTVYRVDAPVPLSTVRAELDPGFNGWNTIYGINCNPLVRGPQGTGPLHLYDYSPGLMLNGATATRYVRFTFYYRQLLWLATWLAALAVAAHIPRWRRAWVARRLARNGLCSACGYDLRATPARCPECGAMSTHASIPS